MVLDALAFDEIKTKQVTSLMKAFELDDMLVVVAEQDDAVVKSARNLPNVTVLPSEGLNVYDVLNHRNLVMTRAAVEAVVERLGK